MIFGSYFSINVNPSQKARKPTFEKLVLHNLTHMKDTHKPYNSTCILDEFAFFCLDTLIEMGYSRCKLRSKRQNLEVFNFSDKTCVSAPGRFHDSGHRKVCPRMGPEVPVGCLAVFITHYNPIWSLPGPLWTKIA